LAASEIFTSKVGAQPAQNLFKQKRRERERKIKIGALLLNQHFKRDLFLAPTDAGKGTFRKTACFAEADVVPLVYRNKREREGKKRAKEGRENGE
jgi:hypothetical protein